MRAKIDGEFIYVFVLDLEIPAPVGFLYKYQDKIHRPVGYVCWMRV